MTIWIVKGNDGGEAKGKGDHHPRSGVHEIYPLTIKKNHFKYKLVGLPEGIEKQPLHPVTGYVWNKPASTKYV